MKISFILILALLSVAVLTDVKVEAQTGINAGSTDDDFKEATDVIKSEDVTTSMSTTKEGTFGKKEGEISGETIIEEEYGIPIEIKYTKTVENPDGTTSTIWLTKTVTNKITKKTKSFKTLKTYTKQGPTIRALLDSFESNAASEQTDQDFELINAIAATDGDKFESSYSHVWVRLENIQETLNAIAKTMITPLSSEDINSIDAQIRTCDGGFYKSFDTSAKEVHTFHDWTIKTEFILANCAGNHPAVQIFVFSGSKQGVFKDGMYSEPNDKTVDRIVTNWLNRQALHLFRCPSYPKLPSAVKTAYSFGKMDLTINPQYTLVKPSV